MSKQANKVIVAIDGPAGAGKSTVAKKVAAQARYVYVDTGALYRSVALIAKKQNIGWSDETRLSEIVRDIQIEFVTQCEENTIKVNGEDVTEAIRTPDVSLGASQVSAIPSIREGLLGLQRKLAGQGGTVLEGRDIGTVVCPKAHVKIYLDADPNERARRRFAEQQGREIQQSRQQVLTDIQKRDHQDSNRKVAPLKAASDAIHINSTDLSIEQVVERILKAIEHAETKTSKQI